MSSFNPTQPTSLDKVQALRARGINPYPYRYDRTHKAQAVKTGYDPLDGQPVRVAGRIMALRRHGQATFADLDDESGRIQLHWQVDRVGAEAYSLLDLLEPGDFVGAEGTVFQTRSGETTIAVDDYTILAKAIRPLPDKWHGLQNIETRYRQRYIDLVMNPSLRTVFVIRTQIIKIIRRILDAKGFLEVETPILQPIYGGALARPFVTHYNALDCEMYLRIANELYLKRLLVAGFEGVYEIARDFRNEGMDRTHNPEFTQVEFYWAYRDYHDMMDLTEEIFTTIAQEVLGSLTLSWRGETIDLTPPWPRRPMLDLIGEHTGIPVATMDEAALRNATAQVYQTYLHARPEALTRALAALPALNRGQIIAALFDLTVEPHLTGPVFVTDYPLAVSPLAKVHRDDETLTERFELYIQGCEMANAFSELNDPVDQRRRFEAQQRQLDAGDAEVHPLDEDFLRAMAYGMPPMGGEGLGIDRLTMLFTDHASIQDVILFPHLRPDPSLGQTVGAG